MIRNRSDIEPVVGKPVKFDQMIITPTYVRESETPQPNGACLTHDYTDREINPAGWYVRVHERQERPAPTARSFRSVRSRRCLTNLLDCTGARANKRTHSEAGPKLVGPASAVPIRSMA